MPIDTSRHSPHDPGSVLITGASRGIGKVVALGMAARGYRVALNYRSSVDAAEQLAHSIRAGGGHAVTLEADIADAEQARELVARAEREIGSLAVLVNNAGITRDRLLLQMSEQDWDSTWLTDLAGPRAAARAAMTSMVRRGGRIINVGSVVGVTGNAGQSNYAAAKAALLGLTRELALEGAASGVLVNCVVPGYIVTDATAHLTVDQRESWIRRIPMRRSAQPEDVAEAIFFLASDHAAYITGQCLAVDGGLLAAEGHGLAS